jgi:hypothetical protein
MIEQIVDVQGLARDDIADAARTGFHLQPERGSRGIQRAAAKDIEISRFGEPNVNAQASTAEPGPTT